MLRIGDFQLSVTMQCLGWCHSNSVTDKKRGVHAVTREIKHVMYLVGLCTVSEQTSFYWRWQVMSLPVTL